MKDYFVLILLVVVGLRTPAFSQQTSARPTQGATVAFFNDRFGSPGGRVGYEMPVWEQFRPKNNDRMSIRAFILKANISFYNHKRHHKGIVVNTSIGYRYTGKNGVMVEPLHLGFGFMRSVYNGPTYEVKNNQVTSFKSAGQNAVVLPYVQLIGLGYDFRQRTKLPLQFFFSLDPYWQRSVNTQNRLRLATPVGLTYYFI